MPYLIAILILLFSTLIGAATVQLLDVKKYKHVSVYGLMVYFSGFFILSGVFTFLHLPWNLYFWVMTIYHVFLILGSVYICFWLKKDKLTQWTSKNFIEYVKNNWVVYLVIFCFIVLYLLSRGSFIFGMKYSYGLAIIDDTPYLSRASHIVNSLHMVQSNINPLTGVYAQWSGIDYLLLVNFWEFFWGYGSALFQVKLTVFSRLVVPIIIYIFTFFSVDECLHLCFAKKDYQRVRFVLVGFLLMYAINGMQLELSKFMFLPWFGNNFSLLLYIPILTILTYHALHDKKGLMALLLLPFISVGFTTVTMVYTFVLFPFSLYIVKKYKDYTFKNEKLVFIIGAIIVLIFGAVSIYGSLGGLVPLQEIYGYSERTILGEKEFFLASFRDKIALIFPGLLLFLYRKNKKELFKYEKEIIYFLSAVLFLALVPVLTNVFFNLFSFSYRRFLESILLFFVLYSVFNLLLSLGKVTFKKLCMTAIILAVIFNKTSGFFIIQHRSYFSKQNLFSITRKLPVAEELTAYFETIKEPQYICIYPDRALQLITDNEISVDLGSAISEIPQHYLVLRCNEETEIDQLNYVVISGEMTIADLPQKLNVKEEDLVNVIETDELTLKIYKVI